MIIAIDPGTTQSAYVVFDGQKALEAVILPNGHLLELLRGGYFGGTALAIEWIASYGMGVGQEVFDTCKFVGRVEEIWAGKQLPFRLVFRKDVKLHLCQNMRAKDSNIRLALIDKYGVVGTKKKPGPLFGVSSHLWSALAVASYAMENPV